MARPVYSTNFIAVAGSFNTHVKYTVDDSHVAVVRDCDIYFNSLNPEFAFYLSDAITIGTFFQKQITLAEVGAPTWVQWQGRQVFGPGTSFQIYFEDSLNVGGDARVSGYLLTYP